MRLLGIVNWLVTVFWNVRLVDNVVMDDSYMNIDVMVGNEGCDLNVNVNEEHDSNVNVNEKYDSLLAVYVHENVNACFVMWLLM